MGNELTNPLWFILIPQIPVLLWAIWMRLTWYERFEITTYAWHGFHKGDKVCFGSDRRVYFITSTTETTFTCKARRE